MRALRKRYGHGRRAPDATAVIFRKWPKSEGGGIIALFPEEQASTTDPYLIGSYEHMGGHGSADPSLVHSTSAAKPEEYAALKRELESAPYSYKLHVMKRIQRRR